MMVRSDFLSVAAAFVDLFEKALRTRQSAEASRSRTKRRGHVTLQERLVFILWHSRLASKRVILRCSISAFKPVDAFRR